MCSMSCFACNAEMATEFALNIAPITKKCFSLPKPDSWLLGIRKGGSRAGAPGVRPPVWNLFYMLSIWILTKSPLICYNLFVSFRGAKPPSGLYPKPTGSFKAAPIPATIYCALPFCSGPATDTGMAMGKQILCFSAPDFEKKTIHWLCIICRVNLITA
jgi:hypothetical protein